MIETIAKQIVDTLHIVLGNEHESALKELETKLETILMAERLKVDTFRDLLKERIELYKDIWKAVEAVSYSKWRKEKGGSRIIDSEAVGELKQALAELNAHRGYLLDPSTRGFLLELRFWCDRCIEKATNGHVHFISKVHATDYTYPHGFKLWVSKTALRRSLVLALQTPRAGNELFFDFELQKAILERSQQSILHESRRLCIDPVFAEHVISQYFDEFEK